MNIWLLIFLNHIPQLHVKLPPSFHTGMDINHTWNVHTPHALKKPSCCRPRHKILAKTNVKTSGSSVAISTQHLQSFNNGKKGKFSNKIFSTSWICGKTSAYSFWLLLGVLWIRGLVENAAWFHISILVLSVAMLCVWSHKFISCQAKSNSINLELTLAFWTNFCCVLSLSLFNYMLNQLKAQIVVFHYCGNKSDHFHVFRIVVFHLNEIEVSHSSLSTIRGHFWNRFSTRKTQSVSYDGV